MSGVPGEKGEPGETGPVGPAGPVGERGQEGTPGLRGPVGSPGPTGPPGDYGLQGVGGPVGSPGPQGPLGPQGIPGETANCGETYVRWGRTTCPQNVGTELVYSGRAGGSWYNFRGGASNYLCMPDDPDYLQFASGSQGRNYVYGVEYELSAGQPLHDVHGHNVPCAVCTAVSRCSLLMIPAKTQCPTNWTTEYVGYLMSGYQKQALSTEYECVDKDPESVPGLDATGWHQGNGSAILNHVEATCNGMACPPYEAWKELTCVVCTR